MADGAAKSFTQVSKIFQAARDRRVDKQATVKGGRLRRHPGLSARPPFNYFNYFTYIILITFTALALVAPKPPHASFPQPIQALLPALHSLHFWPGLYSPMAPGWHWQGGQSQLLTDASVTLRLSSLL
eukprot:g73327.t1